MAVLFNHRFMGGISTAGPASYATGGIALDFETALPHSRQPAAVLVDTDSTTYGARYDLANKKVIGIVRATGAEVTATTNLSAVTFSAVAFFDK